MRSILIKTAFFIALFALSGCFSFEAALMSLPVESKVPVVEDIDYSYPASGAVAATGSVVFKFKPGFWEKLFRNPPPPIPANENEIIVYLGFVIDFSWDSGWIPPERSGGTGALLWAETDKRVGKYDILFGNASRQGQLVMRKHPSNPKGVEPRLIVLDSATTETVSVEMNDFIAGGRTGHVVRYTPPYWWGDLVLRGKAYRIFAVIEEDYYAKYPDFSQRERKGKLGSRVETTAHFFLKPEQKFQITDNFRVVMAELRGDAYTLYDTLPQAEWDDMKQALALLHAFRYIARRLLY
jgi:hypothetical protein